MKIDSNLVVFITGASSGFGIQVGLDLLKKGCKCYLTDKDDIELQLISQYSSSQVVFRNLDVTNEEGIKKAIEDCVMTFGHIDAVLNSAGIGSLGCITSGDCNNKALERCLNINVIGTFNVSKYAALQMAQQQKQNKERKDYAIINVGSIASVNALERGTIYGASKGAVLSMTIPMARDLGKYGIRVVCICPGFFNTNMVKQIPEENLKNLAKLNCLGRHGEPSEFSSAFQAIIENTFINGTHFQLDSQMGIPNL
ncbi:enoyl-(acyl carrier) reductase (macronuclear) [Tetrahymena thermophila SB210]|uniref:Enoyl-(Acyl carrier) reductase n=1 Tax=Tetrahymena thermophila (strain SB210) TaxID=312017 RepID=Q236R9_TETTS|nr:enoyl-(acyl carrier) reductase [Tetrahymena thermophila SB210]EAR92431.1 enoyl-(acyl carrier) reductase [Tetrahymena thermophila SB210]|eukprot:XP_001012676.1 enoyl-(acyl carrier) reductase [Tetrahymena thermophila SB210]